ncbi:MAG TPA: hypothetical protein VGE01_11350 [Fimbriimonas sp.]
MAQRYQVEPEPGVIEEIRQKGTSFESLMKEAKQYLDDPDVETMALARMFIERGYSEPTAYWLVREADVERAPGQIPDVA